MRNAPLLTAALAVCCAFCLSIVPAEAQGPTGALDPSFAPIITGNPSVNLTTLLVLTNDKVLIGGTFTNISGVNRRGIARLSADGTPDTSFITGTGAGGGDPTVLAIATQPADGKILIGGSFTSFNGTNRVRLARLNTNGSLDLTFTVGLNGANGAVRALVVQPNGKILVGGDFSIVNGKVGNGIARLNTDGSPDTNFVSGAGATSQAQVNAVALQSDGNVIIGGKFTLFNGASRPFIARLYGTNGAPDTSFNASAGDYVTSLALDPSGRVLVGGAFTSIASLTCFGLTRLLSNGGSDTNFTPNVDFVDAGLVSTVARQANGKIYVGGNFWSVNSVSRPSFARLNADGTLDEAFLPDPPTGPVVAIGRQSTGAVLLMGQFLIFGSQGGIQANLARINGDLTSTAGPSLSNPERLASAFRFDVEGEIGTSYIIQASSDLSSWSSLATQIQASASQSFTNSVSGSSRKFYRAQVGP